MVICHERPFVLKDRFHRHELFLIDVARTTCYVRPPDLRDRFCWAEEVVSQYRLFCTYTLYGILSELNVLKSNYPLPRVVNCVRNGVALSCVSCPVQTEEEGFNCVLRGLVNILTYLL